MTLTAHLYLRVGQFFCLGFISLLFLIFSFHSSLDLCIKTHSKTQKMTLKRLYFSKFSGGAWPRTPLGVLVLLGLVGQIHVRSSPSYIYVSIMDRKICYSHQLGIRQAKCRHPIWLSDLGNKFMYIFLEQ